jgi:hypothetical protein
MLIKAIDVGWSMILQCLLHIDGQNKSEMLMHCQPISLIKLMCTLVDRNMFAGMLVRTLVMLSPSSSTFLGSVK